MTCDMNRLAADVAAIDRVLRLFDPNLRVEEIKALAFYKPEGWAEPGQVNRLVLDVLRRAGEPVTAAYIVEAVSSDLGGSELRNKRRVAKVLGRLRERGLVRSAGSNGLPLLWEIAR